MLEGINDHENLGAIARTARGLGADALLLDPTCADPFYRRSVRVSMGELLHLPIVRCHDWPAAFDQVAAAGFEIWALTPSLEADRHLHDDAHRRDGRWWSAPKDRACVPRRWRGAPTCASRCATASTR